MSDRIKLLKARTELADKKLAVAELLSSQRRLEKDYFRTKDFEEKTSKLKQLIDINERIVEAKRLAIVKYKELTLMESRVNGKVTSKLNNIN